MLTKATKVYKLGLVKENSNFPLSIQASILIGSLVIGVCVLLAGGVIKPMGTSGSLAAGNAVPAGSAQPLPSSSGNPVVQGVTAGNLPVLGDSNAKVLVVEFADYQCPFCEQFFSQAYPQIKKDYIDTGKIKFAFRDFPFLGQPTTDPAGDESMNAANAARCANDQGKFWDYHDYLYSHQGQEDGGTFSKDNLKKFASDMGLNASQFNLCVDNNVHLADAKNDMDSGKTYGVSGTPTVFINGVELVGAQPYSVFKQVIDQQLASAK